MRDPTLNAFSLPNGRIYVHTGLLACLESEAQLAMILGARDDACDQSPPAGALARAAGGRPSASTIVTSAASIGLELATDASVGASDDIGTAALSGTASTILGRGLPLAAEAAIYGHGPALERDADAGGIARLVRAGYDPKEAPRAFDALRTRSRSRGSFEIFFFGRRESSPSGRPRRRSCSGRTMRPPRPPRTPCGPRTSSGSGCRRSSVRMRVSTSRRAGSPSPRSSSTGCSRPLREIRWPMSTTATSTGFSRSGREAPRRVRTWAQRALERYESAGAARPGLRRSVPAARLSVLPAAGDRAGPRSLPAVSDARARRADAAARRGVPRRARRLSGSAPDRPSRTTARSQPEGSRDRSSSRRCSGWRP